MYAFIINVAFFLHVSSFAHRAKCPYTNNLVGDSSLQTEFTQQSLYPSVYDQVLNLYAPHKELRDLHAAAMPTGKVKIIDAGGGTGLLTRHLLKADPQRQIDIFDMSKEMTGVAQDRGVDAKNIHISSITNLIQSNGRKVPDRSVDGIMTNNVLYILPKDQVREFFEESRRVLKVGGKLSISSMKAVEKPVMDKFLTSLKEDVKAMEDKRLVPFGSSNIFFKTNQKLTDKSEKAQQPPTTFTNEEIIALAESYGFRPIVKDGVGYQGTAFFVSFERMK